MSRLGLLALSSVLCLATATAEAQSADAFDDAATGRWAEQRVRAARLGRADLVELPLARASMGWGCVCPGTYLGTSPDSGGGPWLDVKLAPGVTCPTRRGAAT